MNRAIIAIAAAAILVVAATGFLLITDHKEPEVTLSSNGVSLGKVPIAANGLVNQEKLREFEDRLINQGSGDLNFAGWFFDNLYTKPFFRFTIMKESTALYAGWGEPMFTMQPTDPKPGGTPPNRVSYTLTNTTETEFGDTTWTLVDSFKTSTPRTMSAPYFEKSDRGPTYTSPGPLDTWTVDLMPGMYEVTMRTVIDGDERTITRTEVVNDPISRTLTWNGYDYKTYTITFGIDDINEYVEYAKNNQRREFRISNIASFIVITPTVQKIADAIIREVELKYPSGYTPQELMNVISPFVVSVLWASDSDYYFVKGLHKEHAEGSVEYYKYPIEAIYDTILFNSQGDCDCKSILIAAIAKAAGFQDVAVFTITGPEGHAVAGIRDPSFVKEAQTGPVFFLDPDDWDGYFVSEGNQGHWRLGYMAKKYESDEFLIRLWPLAT
ncbi:MAG: hypothetical protein LBH69_05760 [Methanomassiliicoccaceae archaeon]|jgi:hypothetical protein|nr:hypothetical protein [Methanomassiliicoccaceae archaeon]